MTPIAPGTCRGSTRLPACASCARLPRSLLLAAPVGLVFYRTFEHGFGRRLGGRHHAGGAARVLAHDPDGRASRSPLNTVFGVICAIALVRHSFPRARRCSNAVIDLPFAVSPVVIGLALILVYGQTGWFGDWLARAGDPGDLLRCPGMILATMFVSLPFVVREVMPVLREIGTEQEQAAADARRVRVADLLAGHAALDPLGRSPTASCWRPRARSASSAP